MTTITLPPDVANQLDEAAKRQGTTTELLAVATLRRCFPPISNGTAAPATSMADFLAG